MQRLIRTYHTIPRRAALARTLVKRRAVRQ
jgi:hypothetical protein